MCIRDRRTIVYQDLMDRFLQSFTKWMCFGCRWLIWTSFPYLKGCCHGNQFGKNGNFPSFVALAFQNRMGYHYLNVHINSINDASISCKNFANFGPVTPELTELICERLVRHGKKTGVFSRISQDILDWFRNLFTIWVQICQQTLPGNQIMLGETRK